LGKAFLHFLRRLQVIIRRNETLGSIEIEILAVFDALEHLVRFGVRGCEIMAIHGRDALNSVAFSPKGECLIHLILLGKARTLKLEIKISAKPLLKPKERFL